MVRSSPVFLKKSIAGMTLVACIDSFAESLKRPFVLVIANALNITVTIMGDGICFLLVWSALIKLDVETYGQYKMRTCFFFLRVA
jgi:hypothetical protein